MITIGRYKNTRYWAVWKEEELIAVVCYKKGATAIKKVLTELLKHPTIKNPARSKPSYSS